jgi:iron(III) transport system substrate-binding protein
MTVRRIARALIRGRKAVWACMGALVLALQAPAVHAQAELDALVKAARSEGEVMFYSAPVENVAKRLADAFKAKYGINARFVRLVSNTLLQRYSAEAESGNVAADLFINAGNAPVFEADALKKGWIMRIAEANLPVVRSGEFPARFNKGASAVAQVTPWVMAYNTDKVKGADIPKTWADILHPRFQGQIILPDPAASDAYAEFWAPILQQYGEKFFADLRALNPRRYGQGAQAGQALAAGEGSLFMPLTAQRAAIDRARGAPVDAVMPEDATGVEMQLLMTHSAKAKHPNAARLFANYLLSPEGNKVFNDDPGTISVYDTTRLPKRYVSPSPESLKIKDQLPRLLGFK